MDILRIIIYFFNENEVPKIFGSVEMSVINNKKA